MSLLGEAFWVVSPLSAFSFLGSSSDALLQLMLCHQWDFTDESVVVPWTPEVESDLLWWFETDHLLQGASLEVQHPDLLFWSDASDQGWAPISTINLPRVVGQSRNALCRSTSANFERSVWGSCISATLLRGMTVGVFTDNTAALSYVIPVWVF